jgi:hypothetical protein
MIIRQGCIPSIRLSGIMKGGEEIGRCKVWRRMDARTIPLLPPPARQAPPEQGKRGSFRCITIAPMEP